MGETAKKPFKQRMQELCDLVEELERGELDLEDAIQRFERGKRLHEELLADLARYERRLEKLVEGTDGQDGVLDAAELDEEGCEEAPPAP